MKNKTQGFTLIETLVAILILTVAITGPLSIASRGLNAALIAKDQTTASYLAQDAIEYIRAARDTNRAAGGDWISGAAGVGTIINLTPCTQSGGCTVDALNYETPSTWPPANCSSPPCPALNVATVSGNTFYTQASLAGAKTSPFTRTVNISTQTTQGAQSDEAEVVVTVSWKDVGSVTHAVVVREDLFNWE